MAAVGRYRRSVLAATAAVAVSGALTSAAWAPGFTNVGLMQSGGQEASPIFFAGQLYLVQSVMGIPEGNRSNGAHSFFCVYDATSGETVACPKSSSGWAFCSSIVDRTAAPPRAWVFCSAWDRANHTVNGQNHSMVCGVNQSGWGCGGCAFAELGLPGPGCSVGAWSSTDMVSWDGPHPAVTLPGNITVPNVAVTMIPSEARKSVALQTGLPQHQAFMALESRSSLAINTGTDRDLSKNWELLPMAKGGYTSFGLACPTARYNPNDEYYYVFGGGADIQVTRSRDLMNWTRANRSMATGCIAEDVCLKYRRECPPDADNSASCCVEKPGWCTSSGGNRIAPDYFVKYWANHSDCRQRPENGPASDCIRQYIANETEWNWSVNDADFTDEGGKGPTRFIFGLSQQTKPVNFTGKGGGGYQVGTFPGTELEFLASYF
mmetsp:Transcript_29461/g.77236  ORF Transcript_29461/g.77236 Transcript_29461/m.77236 type:complete len:435 (+) Transcript_29461:67-1371(+)